MRVWLGFEEFFGKQPRSSLSWICRVLKRSFHGMCNFPFISPECGLTGAGKAKGVSRFGVEDLRLRG